MPTKKLYIIEASDGSGSYNEDDYHDDTNITIEARPATSKDITSLVNHTLLDEFLKDDTIVDMLRERGYVHIKSLKDKVEQVVAEKRFMICENRASPFMPPLKEIDLDRLNKQQIKYLAKDNVLFMQVLNKGCLEGVSPEAYALFRKEKTRLAKKAKNRAAALQKTAEKRKLREIEKAKKFLANAGVKV